MQKLPITQADHDQLSAELKNLKDVERPAIIQDIVDARSNGDLKENADYHAAREKQGHIEDRIRMLEDRLARAEIIKHDTAAHAHIIFGATVTVKNQSTNKEQTYTIVSPDAMDPLAGKISNTSPIGKALIGKKRGEIVEVQTPRGVTKLEILDYK
jgi:transcription elongation factor GreA